MKKCSVIIPIKPEYVDLILKGEKKYEYRKTYCKRQIDTMLLYSTYPVQNIVAEVEVLDILSDTPNAIWNLTKNTAGITENTFFNYYAETNLAVAYQLGEIKYFDTPKQLSDYGIEYVPRSFVYVSPPIADKDFHNKVGCKKTPNDTVDKLLR